MLKAIGKILELTRIRKDLSLNDVSNDLDIHKETLKRYENGSNGLSLERLEQILKYYKVDTTVFFKNVCEYMHEND